MKRGGCGRAPHCRPLTVGCMLRTLRPGQLAFDIAAPTALFLLLLPVYWQDILVNGLRDDSFVLFGMCLSLVFRRLHAGIALSLAWLAAVWQMAAGLGPDPANLAILAILYATASYGTPLVRWLGLAS